jgi:hypothetical protein
MSDATTPNSPPIDSVPLATRSVRTKKRLSWMWLATTLCAALSLLLFLNTFQNQGDLIEIDFEDGHGLAPADALRFRGIEVGRVEKIGLKSNSNTSQSPGITVSVRLTPAARKTVTDGTLFWIVRPIVSIESIRGLETIVGPKYIAMEPGDSLSYTSKHFQGLEVPPPIRPKEGSIEIILDANKRFSLDSGTPILHRGFHVGNVLSVSLASDARSVLVRCAIDPEYHELVRSNTKFWMRSGWRFGIGLSGISLEADSLSQILYGGIEFATPDHRGRIVSTGARFHLHESPEDEWTKWNPSLPYGALWEKLQRQSPVCYRTSLTYKQSSFGFQVTKQKVGWGLLFDDGSLFLREDFATLPQNALPNSGQLEVAGVSLPHETLPSINTTETAEKITVDKIPMSLGTQYSMLRLRLPSPPVTPSPPLDPMEFLQPSSDPIEDILIVTPETERSVLIDKTRFTQTEQGLLLDSTVLLPTDLDGAPVIDVRRGRWLGVLHPNSQKNIISLPTRKP